MAFGATVKFCNIFEAGLSDLKTKLLLLKKDQLEVNRSKINVLFLGRKQRREQIKRKSNFSLNPKDKHLFLVRCFLLLFTVDSCFAFSNRPLGSSQ